MGEEVILVQEGENMSVLEMGCRCCEVGRTLEGGYCERVGEVEFRGVLLCGRHARQFEARDRVDLLRGIASSLELSLRSIPLHRDANLTLLLRTERAGAAQNLNLAREELRRAVEDVA